MTTDKLVKALRNLVKECEIIRDHPERHLYPHIITMNEARAALAEAEGKEDRLRQVLEVLGKMEKSASRHLHFNDSISKRDLNGWVIIARKLLEDTHE